jgi:coenzyme F420-reducing hydrogenase delta subunit
LGADIASKLDFEAVPCGGRIGFEQISGALRHYGKVMILICMDGACLHFDGNIRARGQADRLTGMLEVSGVDKSRVRYIMISHAMENVLKEEIGDLLKEVAPQ